VNTLVANTPDVLTNPVRDRAQWAAMRAAALADPGAFHGDIAARGMHWFVHDAAPSGAWLARGEDGRWHGWDAATGAAVSPDLPADFTPWKTGFDGSAAPHWRWFVGGRTNAAFSEIDRHVLAGHGEEAALIFEGDRWDMAADGGRGAPLESERISRRRLLVETAK
jgi:acrylyl-CoA reductase (NADPH)/3-hydroxypropionyl-CoA dehydratase/3-hydroxypropionyl-CoA synthetase